MEQQQISPKNRRHWGELSAFDFDEQEMKRIIASAFFN
jgi:hypothetical protein